MHYLCISKKMGIMNKSDIRRMKFARLLLLVYLPLLIAVTFHHHSEAERASAVSFCQNCINHVHHNGHLTAQTSFSHDCVLCQLQSLPYVVPTTVRIAVFMAIAHIVYIVSCPFVKTREDDVFSTRAPPALASL